MSKSEFELRRQALNLNSGQRESFKESSLSNPRLEKSHTKGRAPNETSIEFEKSITIQEFFNNPENTSEIIDHIPKSPNESNISDESCILEQNYGLPIGMTKNDQLLLTNTDHTTPETMCTSRRLSTVSNSTENRLPSPILTQCDPEYPSTNLLPKRGGNGLERGRVSQTSVNSQDHQIPGLPSDVPNRDSFLNINSTNSNNSSSICSGLQVSSQPHHYYSVSAASTTVPAVATSSNGLMSISENHSPTQNNQENTFHNTNSIIDTSHQNVLRYTDDDNNNGMHEDTIIDDDFSLNGNSKVDVLNLNQLVDDNLKFNFHRRSHRHSEVTNIEMNEERDGGIHKNGTDHLFAFQNGPARKKRKILTNNDYLIDDLQQPSTTIVISPTSDKTSPLTIKSTIEEDQDEGDSSGIEPSNDYTSSSNFILSSTCLPPMAAKSNSVVSISTPIISQRGLINCQSDRNLQSQILTTNVGSKQHATTTTLSNNASDSVLTSMAAKFPSTVDDVRDSNHFLPLIKVHKHQNYNEAQKQIHEFNNNSDHTIMKLTNNNNLNNINKDNEEITTVNINNFNNKIKSNRIDDENDISVSKALSLERIDLFANFSDSTSHLDNNNNNNIKINNQSKYKRSNKESVTPNDDIIDSHHFHESVRISDKKNNLTSFSVSPRLDQNSALSVTQVCDDGFENIMVSFIEPPSASLFDHQKSVDFFLHSESKTNFNNNNNNDDDNDGVDGNGVIKNNVMNSIEATSSVQTIQQQQALLSNGNLSASRVSVKPPPYILTSRIGHHESNQQHQYHPSQDAVKSDFSPNDGHLNFPRPSSTRTPSKGQLENNSVSVINEKKIHLVDSVDVPSKHSDLSLDEASVVSTSTTSITTIPTNKSNAIRSHSPSELTNESHSNNPSGKRDIFRHQRGDFFDEQMDFIPPVASPSAYDVARELLISGLCPGGSFLLGGHVSSSLNLGDNNRSGSNGRHLDSTVSSGTAGIVESRNKNMDDLGLRKQHFSRNTSLSNTNTSDFLPSEKNAHLPSTLTTNETTSIDKGLLNRFSESNTLNISSTPRNMNAPSVQPGGSGFRLQSNNNSNNNSNGMSMAQISLVDSGLESFHDYDMENNGHVYLSSLQTPSCLMANMNNNNNNQLFLMQVDHVSSPIHNNSNDINNNSNITLNSGSPTAMETTASANNDVAGLAGNLSISNAISAIRSQSLFIPSQVTHVYEDINDIDLSVSHSGSGSMMTANMKSSGNSNIALTSVPSSLTFIRPTTTTLCNPPSSQALMGAFPPNSSAYSSTQQQVQFHNNPPQQGINMQPYHSSNVHPKASDENLMSSSQLFITPSSSSGGSLQQQQQQQYTAPYHSSSNIMPHPSDISNINPLSMSITVSSSIKQQQQQQQRSQLPISLHNPYGAIQQQNSDNSFSYQQQIQGSPPPPPNQLYHQQRNINLSTIGGSGGNLMPNIYTVKSTSQNSNGISRHCLPHQTNLTHHQQKAPPAPYVYAPAGGNFRRSYSSNSLQQQHVHYSASGHGSPPSSNYDIMSGVGNYSMSPHQNLSISSAPIIPPNNNFNTAISQQPIDITANSNNIMPLTSTARRNHNNASQIHQQSEQAASLTYDSSTPAKSRAGDMTLSPPQPRSGRAPRQIGALGDCVRDLILLQQFIFAGRPNFQEGLKTLAVSSSPSGGENQDNAANVAAKKSLCDLVCFPLSFASTAAALLTGITTSGGSGNNSSDQRGGLHRTRGALKH